MPIDTDKTIETTQIGDMLIDLKEDSMGMRYYVIRVAEPRSQYCSVCGSIVEFKNVKFDGGTHELVYTDDAGHIYKDLQ